jgi:DNA transformation protein
MFGGHGVYIDGCSSRSSTRAAPGSRRTPRAKRTSPRAGCSPFVFEARGKQIPTSYWSVPESALDSPRRCGPGRAGDRGGAAQAGGARRRRRRRRRPRKADYGWPISTERIDTALDTRSLKNSTGSSSRCSASAYSSGR